MNYKGKARVVYLGTVECISVVNHYYLVCNMPTPMFYLLAMF